ncbi:MAG: hypothetical protein CUN57_02365, partial [Phototrophicales bacterium]
MMSMNVTMSSSVIIKNAIEMQMNKCVQQQDKSVVATSLAIESFAAGLATVAKFPIPIMFAPNLVGYAEQSQGKLNAKMSPLMKINVVMKPII